MTQRKEVANVLESLDVLTFKFLQNLSDAELKKLRPAIENKSLIISRILKERSHQRTHFQSNPESKKVN